MSLPEPIQQLLAALNKLPGIGPRSAERIALHLVQTDPGEVEHLARAITQGRAGIRDCEICGALTEQTPCGICRDDRRDGSLVCVVEKAVDILALEKGRTFPGRYHVLGGKLSPLNGVEPEDLNISSLEQRLAREPITELVMALPTDVEGDATSHYLAQRLSSRGVKVTRIAHGLPAGSGLEYADELTLNRALAGRRELT